MKKTLSIIFLSLLVFSLAAQDKALSVKDYGRWSRIMGTNISNDGKWMHYTLRPNGGDDTLFIQNLDADKFYKINYASSASFSENSQWASYLIRPSKEEEKKLRKSRKPILNTAGLINLNTGEKVNYDRAESMDFANTSKYFVVLRKKPADDNTKHEGKDLIIRNLENGTVLNIGNVGSYAFNKKGSMLAYTIDADGMLGNGLYVLNLNTNEMRALDTDSARYSQLTWDDANAHRNDWNNRGKHLAVLKGNTADKEMHRNNTLLVFSNVGLPAYQKKSYANSALSGIPDGMIISENGNLRWSEDGTLVFFGIKEQEKKQKMSKDTIPNVDVWHWKDETIQTVQMRRAEQMKRFTFLCSVDVNSGRFSRLADDNMRMVMLSKHAQFAIGRDEKPYINDVNWGVSPADFYRVNIRTGAKEIFAKDVRRPLGTSPDGRYFLFQLDSSLHVYDVNLGKLTNVSKSAAVNFMNLDHPYPHEKPPYGLAGWTKDGKHVVVNHDFDLWMLALDGSRATNLTAGVGTKEFIRFRYTDINSLEEYIDTKKPILLSAYGEWTKKSGYYTVVPGQSPRALIYEDRSIGRPNKALNAERIIFTAQTFEDFPDYYVSNTNFNNPRKVTNANPQQKEYAWGRRVLVDYTNSKGEKLQGTLTLPANYKEGEKYPMIVYFYEKMSQNHHQYSMPVYDDRPHMSLYASNGYLVLMPDNVFEEGRPGTSSLDCITSAVNKVIDLGYADPKRVGLQGHSWGGYQSSFILTQTDLFACIVTGAPPTNLESFYNNIYGSTGTNHHGIM
ncbi:MAG TPA: prolyl oligopeptidase family serine peptidase, partial [Cyclobacteriaceae bacterium]|nr:prolyl oligopeptidase family serine peptidase [Cyclobacteriaceae bacterium]